MAQVIETVQISFTSTADKTQTFGLDLPNAPTSGFGVQQIILSTSADVYVDFDKPIETSESFLLPAAFTAPLVIDIKGGGVMTVHAQGKSGTGTLYIIGIRT